MPQFIEIHKISRINIFHYYFSNGLCCESALDPAYPGFEGPNARRRLNKTDARFVDVIHTNARFGLNNAVGLETPLGHADFYPNGGSYQPGCFGFSLQQSQQNFITIAWCEPF